MRICHTRALAVFASLPGVMESLKASLGGELESVLAAHFTRTKKVKVLSEAERIGQEVGAIGGVLKPGSLTFLDQRRFNNLAIAMSKLGLENEELKRSAALEAVPFPS